MKNIILPIFSLFLIILMGSTKLFAQKPFEGVVEYEWEFVSSDAKEGEEVSDEGKNNQLLYVKDGKYKSEITGSFEMNQYYKGGDSLFTYMNIGMEQLLWESVSQDADSVFSFELIPNAEKVLGYSCDLLKLQTNRGEFLFYFHSTLAVDPADYRTHKQGFWNFTTEKARALPLKMYSTQNGAYITITATKVTPMSVSDDKFMPPALPRVKSQY